jgi:hypothetical protein
MFFIVGNTLTFLVIKQETALQSFFDSTIAKFNISISAKFDTMWCQTEQHQVSNLASDRFKFTVYFKI